MGYPLRHTRPAGISHIVDVTITTVDVAATGDLYQDRIDSDHVSTLKLGYAGYRLCRLCTRSYARFVDGSSLRTSSTRRASAGLDISLTSISRESLAAVAGNDCVFFVVGISHVLPALEVRAIAVRSIIELKFSMTRKAFFKFLIFVNGLDDQHAR